MIFIYRPEKVVPARSPGVVALTANPFSTVNVVELTGHSDPILDAVVVVVAVTGSLPLFKTQRGNGVHDPPMHVIFNGPPTFTYPFLHIIGRKAPGITYRLSDASLGRLEAPLDAIVADINGF